ncbi:MAG TPA: hypothetical protein PLH98_11845, partial [Ruminococcus flavefaciens]|nr:hypothetical protein [Ruminococcus flavefaciens]
MEDSRARGGKGRSESAPTETNNSYQARVSAQAFILTIESKIRQEGERKRGEGKESPERKTDWEKERGG